MQEALAALRPSDARRPRPPRREGGPKGLNVLGTLARHPSLTRAFFTFNGHVLFGSTLSARQRELLVLRVATLRRSTYEWAQHVLLARDAGLTSEEVARVAQGPDAPGWSALERALLAAVDELVTDAEVVDATWTVLARELDERQLMDVVFTVGAYEVVAMAFRSFRIELDEDLENALLALGDR
jgi:alkylhydroperoxidase family enzyme